MICEQGQSRDCRTEQRQADHEGQNLKAARNELVLVKGLMQNLDVVPERKGDIREVRGEEDKHGPADVDKVLQYAF